MFIPQAQPHAQSLFLFPIVFGINLIHFFDISTRKNGAAGNSIVCFAASIPCQSRRLTARRMRTVSKSATFLATENVNSAPFKMGETEVQIVWQGIAQNSSSILRCTFLARRREKLIANFSATMVTSLPSFSLSLSLSVSLSLSHRMYLTHNIGSASALPIIQERPKMPSAGQGGVVYRLFYWRYTTPPCWADDNDDRASSVARPRLQNVIGRGHGHCAPHTHLDSTGVSKCIEERASPRY